MWLPGVGTCLRLGPVTALLVVQVAGPVAKPVSRLEVVVQGLAVVGRPALGTEAQPE
jgi:hypothetical protein